MQHTPLASSFTVFFSSHLGLDFFIFVLKKVPMLSKASKDYLYSDDLLSYISKSEFIFTIGIQK